MATMEGEYELKLVALERTTLAVIDLAKKAADKVEKYK